MSKDARKALMIARHMADGGMAEETVPEAPHTLAAQLQAFLEGKRKAVLYTHEEPPLPEGAKRLESPHGVFHYNPALIDEPEIKSAIAKDRINDVLGMGPYSKKDVMNRVAAGEDPLAVVGRDAGGREVLTAAGTPGTIREQAAAIAPQLPPGGQVKAESPANVLFERLAAAKSPEQGDKDARKALMIARAMGGRIAKADGGQLDDDEPVFYSQAAKVASALPQKVGPASQMLGMVANAPGIKKDELENAGNPFGDQKITREQLAQHFQENAPQLQDVWVENPKFMRYRLPGGGDYNELLLKLPNKEADRMDARRREIERLGLSATPEQKQEWADIMNRLKPDDRDVEGISKFRGFPEYHSTHWDEPNVLAHTRFDDRTGPNGEKILHVAEVQSDWHQAGRKRGYVDQAKADSLAQEKQNVNDRLRQIRDEETAKADFGVIPTPSDIYRNNPEYRTLHDRFEAIDQELPAVRGGVPDAPFKTTWPELTMKRILRHAAENGYDRVSWDTGDTNADRYDLSKQINTAAAIKNGDGTYNLVLEGKDQQEIHPFASSGKKVTPQEMENTVGKDVAKKLIEGADKNFGRPWPKNQASNPAFFNLRGVDLKVGGEGMRGFYDQILPSVVNKLVKKHGAKVERSELPTAVSKEDVLERGITPGAERTPVHSVDITPSMREAFSKSQPLFKRGGYIQPNNNTAIEQALKLTSKSGAMLPASVYTHAQHKPGRRN